MKTQQFNFYRALALLAILCLATTGCQRSESGPGASNEPGSVSQPSDAPNPSEAAKPDEAPKPSVALEPAESDDDASGSLLGKTLALEGLYLDGTEIDWSSYRGKYVLVDFWTTWCGFCIREIPFNAKLYERYKDAGFEIVAFSCDKDLDALRKFASEHNEPWKIASSKLSAEAEKSYPNMQSRFDVHGYPTMILFDPEGKIVDLNARGAHLQELLEKAFPDVEPISADN